MKNILLQRFIKYVKINTQSNEDTTSVPSSQQQLDFANILAIDLQNIGLQNINLSKDGILSAMLPANTSQNITPIGFIAHLDTAPDLSGENVKPQIITNYNGKSIALNHQYQLSPEEFPELKEYIGKTIICTDGTTLLGADDKAGITEIVCAMQYLIEHPEIEHGNIYIAFTPDEEIGKGVDNFNVNEFGAKYAYTIDGGSIGELEFENFNAAAAKIVILGKNIHPGMAKNIMVNSQLIGIELNNMLPATQRPENTSDYEGFYLLTSFHGNIEKTELKYIIRDHDKDLFEQKKQYLLNSVEKLNKKYGNNYISCNIEDQYYNMKEKIEPVMFIVDIARQAMQECGVKEKILPLRGGTDGARLSYLGLPCPNIFTGGHNFHGRYEYIVLESMEKAMMTIVNIAKIFAQK